jgi:hypothetical protein
VLSDVLQLRLVCKAFAEVLMDIAFRRIVICMTMSHGKEEYRMDTLKTLAEIQEDHPVRVLARKLKIQTLDAELDPKNSADAFNYLEAICRNLKGVDSLVYVAAFCESPCC